MKDYRILIGTAMQARQCWGDDVQMRWAAKPEFRDALSDAARELSRRGWGVKPVAPAGEVSFLGFPVVDQSDRDTLADLEVISRDGEVLEAIPVCL